MLRHRRLVQVFATEESLGSGRVSPHLVDIMFQAPGAGILDTKFRQDSICSFKSIKFGAYDWKWLESTCQKGLLSWTSRCLKRASVHGNDSWRFLRWVHCESSYQDFRQALTPQVLELHHCGWDIPLSRLRGRNGKALESRVDNFHTFHVWRKRTAFVTVCNWFGLDMFGYCQGNKSFSGLSCVSSIQIRRGSFCKDINTQACHVLSHVFQVFHPFCHPFLPYFAILVTRRKRKRS